MNFGTLVLLYLVVGEALAALRNTHREYSGKFAPNGCNFVPEGNWGECCYRHDFDYQTGGWFLARLIADVRLSRCVLQNKNLFAAVIYFIGVRFGGMWAFHYGKKKDLMMF
jgi:hypothetical protein